MELSSGENAQLLREVAASADELALVSAQAVDLSKVNQTLEANLTIAQENIQRLTLQCQTSQAATELQWRATVAAKERELSQVSSAVADSSTLLVMSKKETLR